MHTSSLTTSGKFATKEQSVTKNSALSQFFSPKTVEDQLLIEKFTSSMIREILDLEPFFTREDIASINSCKTSKECLYVTASIVSEIRETQERLIKIFAKK